MSMVALWVPIKTFENLRGGVHLLPLSLRDIVALLLLVPYQLDRIREKLNSSRKVENANKMRLVENLNGCASDSIDGSRRVSTNTNTVSLTLLV